MIQKIAPAKINLFFHITGKMPTGHHRIQSVAMFTDVGDVLEMAPASHFSLIYDGPFADQLPNPKDNLITKVLDGLAEKAKKETQFQIKLTKNLPVASGMGGGSSDAAAVVSGVAGFWGIKFNPLEVSHFLSEFGADLPVCFYARTVLMEGFGEQLRFLKNMPQVFLVLVNPGVAVGTKDAFAKFHGNFSKPVGDFSMEKIATYHNDLFDAACNLQPVIQNAIDALAPHVIFARMTGSGATCFGVCETKEKADQVAGILRADHPDWWVQAAQTI